MKDCFYRADMTESDGSRIFCYRSGLTVFEETLKDGMLVSSGSNTAGYPLNVLQGQPTRLEPAHFYGRGAFDCVLNGISINRRLTFKICGPAKEVLAAGPFRGFGVERTRRRMLFNAR